MPPRSHPSQVRAKTFSLVTGDRIVVVRVTRTDAGWVIVYRVPKAALSYAEQGQAVEWLKDFFPGTSFDERYDMMFPGADTVRTTQGR